MWWMEKHLIDGFVVFFARYVEGSALHICLSFSSTNAKFGISFAVRNSNEHAILALHRAYI